MTRKRMLLWALAFMLALIVGPLLGRGLAWLKVYSEPRRPVIIQIECDCKHCGDLHRERTERKKEAVKQRFF
jgi:hypothetical protein